jgi:hypothetical protein
MSAVESIGIPIGGATGGATAAAAAAAESVAAVSSFDEIVHADGADAARMRSSLRDRVIRIPFEVGLYRSKSRACTAFLPEAAAPPRIRE